MSLPLAPIQTSLRMKGLLPGREHIFSPRPPTPGSPREPYALSEEDMERLVGDDQLTGPTLSNDDRSHSKVSLLGASSPLTSPNSEVEASPELLSSLKFPTPPVRDPAQDVTPRTARRWSIVEVELAYERMKQLIGGTAQSSAGLSTISDAASDDESISGILDTPSRVQFDLPTPSPSPSSAPPSPLVDSVSPNRQYSESHAPYISPTSSSSSSARSARASSPATSGGAPGSLHQISIDSLRPVSRPLTIQKSPPVSQPTSYQSPPPTPPPKHDSLSSPSPSSVTSPVISPRLGGGAPAKVHTWFPATPDRAAHRASLPPPKSAPLGGSIRNNHYEDVASVKSMDKLEIFFKYTAIKADLEKAGAERIALREALHEANYALRDIRTERDELRMEVRSVNRQLKRAQTQGYAPLPTDERAQLERALGSWELRARETMSDLARTKAELDSLRRHCHENHHSQEEEDATITIASQRSPPLPPKPPATPPPHRRGYLLNGRPASPAPASPTKLRSPRQQQLQNQPVSSLPLSWHGSAFDTPSTHAKRSDRPTSHVSPATFDLTSLGDLGSPLMGQRMSFGPKSSSESNASPLKARAPNGSGPRPLLLSSINNARSNNLLRNRPSRDSIVSMLSLVDSDYGEHLPPRAERDWDPAGSGGSAMPGLDEEHERYLEDLTTI